MTDTKPYKLIVIGSIPPPIGGVSVHVKRLVENLENQQLPFLFLDLRREKKGRIAKALFQGELIHLHTSNPYFKLLVSLFCFLTRRNLIVTWHGNLNRYGRFKNLVDKLSVWLVKIPVVLNSNSLAIAAAINKKTVMISAFIPPSSITALGMEHLSRLHALKARCAQVFCTNASYVGYDKNGKEIYQISEMIRIFNSQPQNGLVISDPTGNYANFIKEQGIVCNDNILFFSFPHDFNAVIRDTDCMVRYTTTDGDSLSVKEALYAGKPVIATNVVTRPSAATVIPADPQALSQAIQHAQKSACVYKENGFTDLFQLYCNC